MYRVVFDNSFLCLTNPFVSTLSNIKGLLFNCLIAKLNWSTIPVVTKNKEGPKMI